MSPRRLGVRLGDELVATLDVKKPRSLRCRYEPSVIETGEANRPLLSCSLPVTRQWAPATPWVRGLLPEGNHLLALATRAGVPTNYYADLLERYGRDIAGAMSISEHAPESRRWSVEPYTDAALTADLRRVLDAPGFAVRDDSELSIAGLQNKLLVTAVSEGVWGRPLHGHPSTHIMKLDDAKHAGLLAAEHACMELARQIGLTTVATELVVFDDIEVLVVERYDRQIEPASGAIHRIHQEDSCQALGVDIDAQQGRGKYEQFGGPSFAQIAALLDRYSDPATAQRWLLRTAVFTFAIGNADGHGKNISLLIDTETGSVAPAPLYDTVPTALWPTLRATSAMSVNGTFEPTSLHDFIAEARRWGVGAAAAERVVADLVADLRSAVTGCTHEAVTNLVASRLDLLESN